MEKYLRTSLKQKLDHLKIGKNSRRDGQHPRILKARQTVLKNIVERIFNSSPLPREVSAKNQKESDVRCVLTETSRGKKKIPTFSDQEEHKIWKLYSRINKQGRGKY